MLAFTRTWSRELGKHNIRANAVAPGFIATELVRSMPEKVIQNMVSHTQLGRMGSPEEVAEVYLWLASDASSFITGAVISVDGWALNYLRWSVLNRNMIREAGGLAS